MKINAIVINPKDNVAVLTEAVAAEGAIRTEDAEFAAREDIPSHHKVAIAPIGKGERIVRYGECIGLAAAPIAPGQWVHTHNIRPEDD